MKSCPCKNKYTHNREESWSSKRITFPWNDHLAAVHIHFNKLPTMTSAFIHKHIRNYHSTTHNSCASVCVRARISSKGLHSAKQLARNARSYLTCSILYNVSVEIRSRKGMEIQDTCTCVGRHVHMCTHALYACVPKASREDDNWRLWNNAIKLYAWGRGKPRKWWADLCIW